MKISTSIIAAASSFAIGLMSFSAAVAGEKDVLDGDAMLITSGDPADPTYANAGDNLRTGVGSIFVQFESTEPFGFLCSASAIGDRHILTAAHCLTNSLPDGSPDRLTRIVVIFPSGVNYLFFSEVNDVSGFAVNPLYVALSPFLGAFAPGDVAVIEMTNDLPADVERYELYREDDEFGKMTRHYGHGRSGKGNKGSTGGADFFYARTGLNMYEQTLAPFFGGDPLFDQLLHDFDSGGSKHNAMEWWFTSAFACHPENPDNPPWAQDGQCTTFKDGSYPDFKGFGKLEVGIAPGDSGGPGFIDGKIAGVHSFGFTHFCSGVTNGTDFSCGLNSSYGEMSGDARVSTEAGWIDAVTGGAIETTPIPAPIADAGSAQVDGQTFEVSAGAKAFMNNTFSRRLKTKVSFEEVKEALSID